MCWQPLLSPSNQQPLCNAGLKVISLYSLCVACEHKHAQPDAQTSPFAIGYNRICNSKVFSIQRVSGFMDTGEQVSVGYESVSISIYSGGKDLGAKCPEVSFTTAGFLSTFKVVFFFVSLCLLKSFLSVLLNIHYLRAFGPLKSGISLYSGPKLPLLKVMKDALLLLNNISITHCFLSNLWMWIIH